MLGAGSPAYRMLWAASDVLPEGDGRLKQTNTYELNLERAIHSGQRGGGGTRTPY